MLSEGLKVLHVAVSMNPSAGVVKQMEWEQLAAQELGLKWSLALHTPKKIESAIVTQYAGLSKHAVPRYLELRRKFYAWLRMVEKDYDLILLRHSVHDVFEAKLLHDLGRKIFTVHHTLEMEELRGVGNFSNYVKAFLEEKIGGYSLRRCGGYIGVTGEILRFEQGRVLGNSERKGFVYPNGVRVEEEALVDEREDVPEIIFVAAHFSSWHGLDLLITEARKDPTACIIHIVGKVPADLATLCTHDDRFVLHGSLSSAEMEPLIRRAWCGLSSFALSRNKMTEACTLKVREYLMAGVPVYSGHRDSGLPDDFPYYSCGAPKIREILTFAVSMCSVGRSVVKKEAAKFISKVELLDRLYKQLESR